MFQRQTFHVLYLLACLFTSLVTVTALSSVARASLPTNPVNDPNFMILPGGKDMRSISVSGSKLSLSKGTGTKFTATQQAAYLKLKAESQTNPDSNMQWVLMDLDKHLVIQQSLNPTKRIFGASMSKIFVAGTLLDKQGGSIASAKQWQELADMLVISSNVAWVALQSEIGDGNADKGRETIQAFTQRLGYQIMRGYQGNLGSTHGNELDAAETAEYLHDTYVGNYTGAETLWKMMHACRTGAVRARKYIPSSIIVGAKTGTYDGPSTDPETGKSTDKNGKAFKVAVRNHSVVFNLDGHEYGLSILADTGSDESTAILAGGLIREHLGVTN